MSKALLRCVTDACEVDLKNPLISRLMLATALWPVCCALLPRAAAQDVPGIEICTVEKTMERRTSCLQSNIDFLQKTVTKLGLDHQQKIDAANRQIETLKAAVAALQKRVDELQPKKPVEDQKKSEPAQAPESAKGPTK